MRACLTLAALSALATLSPDTDQGHDLLSNQSGAAPANPAPAATDQSTDTAAPHDNAPAAPAAKAAKSAKAPKAAPAAAAKAGRTGHKAMIWVQPGHEAFSIGELIHAPEDEAEGLRSAGRARYATPEEQAAVGTAADA